MQLFSVSLEPGITPTLLRSQLVNIPADAVQPSDIVTTSIHLFTFQSAMGVSFSG